MKGAKGWRKGCSGFSLVELLTIVIIIGVLVGIAMPGFFVWLPTYRLNRATRDLLSNFQLAKISAIKNHLNCAITFRKGVNGINLGGTVYDYVIYLDADGNLQYDPVATDDGIDNDGDGSVDEGGESERVLARVLFTDYGLNIDFDTSQGGGDGVSFADTAQAAFGGNTMPSFSFLPTGMTRDGGGTPAQGSVFLINNKNNRTTSVSVSLAGSVSIN